MPPKPRTCVVVCYWTGHKPDDLHRLLGQMMKLDAGSPFDVVVVTNGGDIRPLTLPPRFAPLRPRLIDRENVGYNLGAWEQGWRESEGYEYYLFLQDECFLKRPGWVGDFEFRMDRDPGVGLLGERFMWERMSWGYIREATDRDLGDSVLSPDEPGHPVQVVQDLLNRHGLPVTETGEHLLALVHFTSRKILEEIGGYPIVGRSYREAVACEVGISRLIQSRGYRISLIKDTRFTLIGHRQWTARHDFQQRWRGRARGLLNRLGIRRRRKPAPATASAG